MKAKMTIVSLLVLALSVFAAGAGAEHSQHHPAQEQPQAQTMMMGQGMMRSPMMGQGMMGRMMMGSHMMAQRQEMQKLVNEVMESLSALQNEKDPTALKNKLAKDRALLEQLQSKLQHCGMMQGTMGHKKSGPMKSEPEQK